MRKSIPLGAAPRTGPEARKAAAQAWAIEYNHTRKPRGKAERALAVICLSVEIREWLAVNDPGALSQAQQALNGLDYTAFLGATNEDSSEDS